MFKTVIASKTGGIMLVVLLCLGISLPSFFFAYQDQQLLAETKQTTLFTPNATSSDISITQMLSIAQDADQETVLQTGKYLTAERGFTHVKTVLAPLEDLSFLHLEWDSCTLDSYSIKFRISPQDLSLRMVIWTLYISTADGNIISVYLDDQTGKVLGFGYEQPDTPLYTTENPSISIQADVNELLSFFTTYWGVEVKNTRVISQSGQYSLIIDDPDTSLEIPYTIQSSGILLNIPQYMMQK